MGSLTIGDPAPEHAGWLSRRLPEGLYVVPVVRPEMLADEDWSIADRSMVQRVPISLYHGESARQENTTSRGVPEYPGGAHRAGAYAVSRRRGARLPDSRAVRRAGNRWWVALALLAAGAALGTLAPSAAADRRPTEAERPAIKRVALKTCHSGCEYRGARVSTRNERYAWANVVGEAFSGALLRRPTARSRRLKVIGTQGGGIGECSYWRELAPAGVLRDLRVTGLVDAGTVRNCGKRG